MRRLYAGNLSYETKEEELKQLFERHGEVKEAKIITDRETGRSKGFGFVEMVSEEDANRAIEQLDQTEFGGRKLVVNVAREREHRGRR